MVNTFAPPSLTTPLARTRSSMGAPTAQGLSSGYKAPNPVSAGPSSVGNEALEGYQVALRNKINQGQSRTNEFLNQIQAKKTAFAKKYAAEREARGQEARGGSGGYNGGAPPDLGNTGGSDFRNKLVSKAASRLGTPYAWGGGGPGVFASRGTGKGTQGVIGVDCSGLTSWVYSQYGITLPRTSAGQTRTIGYRTSIANARPGDLVGWNKGGHVALYAGNGWLIESPKPGGRVRYRRVPGGTYAVRLSLPGD